MNVRQLKARHFTFIIYEESAPSDWRKRLESIGLPMAISPKHDKDKFQDGSLKKPHWHVIYVARNPVTVESVRKKIKRKLETDSDKLNEYGEPLQVLSHLEIVDNMKGTYEYLTHESKSAIEANKYIYDKKDIELLNEFDIDRYVTLDESQKRELRDLLTELINTYGIVNKKELRAFLAWRGDEFGVPNIRYVNDLLAHNSNYFKTEFDGNYQNGFRPQYARRVNPDTGETIKGVDELGN